MKKVFVIIFMLFIGLQTSFAAVASYCQHEQSSTSHPGHHDHEHKSDSEITGSNSANDSDCGTCHLAHSPFFAESGVSYIHPFSADYVVAINLYFSDLSIPPPYKPNWIHLA